MKIHIVQKGDTLWDISKKYGVDYEEVKQLNSHLSSPDMIMPGMKIKIPSSSKTVKQSQMPKKEMVKQPYKDVSPKPLPVIKEDDKEKKKVVKPEMPVKPLPEMPKMPEMPKAPAQPIVHQPTFEQDFQNYTTINFPSMPHYAHDYPESVSSESSAEAPEKPMYMPVAQQAPAHYVPMCCHFVHPCYPPTPFPMMANVMSAPMHAPPMHGQIPMHPEQKPADDCGCHDANSYHPYAAYPMQQEPQYQNMNYHPQSNFRPSYEENSIPPTNLYPPQYGVASMNNHYPIPPNYPDYKRENEDGSENE